MCSWYLGVSIVNYLLSGRANIMLIVTIGLPFGEILSAWIFFVCTLWFEANIIHCMFHSLFISIIALAITLITPFKQKTFKVAHLRFLFYSTVIPSLFVSYILTISIGFNGNEFRGAAYGDMPFHMNIISSFAFGCNKKRKTLFGVTAPFFAGEPLAYPILPNFYSAVFMQAFNCNYNQAIVIPSLAFVFSLFSILGQITLYFTGSCSAIVVVHVLFLFNGGTGFLHYFALKDNNLFYTDFVHNLGNGKHGCWFHSIIHVILPQRASLFALPISWSIIYLLLSSKPVLDIKCFACIGLLISALPQVQAHALIALFEFGLCYAIIKFPYGNKKQMLAVIANYSMMAAIGLTLGLPQLKNYLGRVRSNFMRIEPVWVESGKSYNFFSFWWAALGVFGVISLVHGPLYLTKNQLLLYIPALFVFFVSNIIIYQPWNLDNTKIFYTAFIPLAMPVVANFFVKFTRSTHNISLALTIPLFITCCISGGFALHMVLTQCYCVWQDYDRDLRFGEWIRRNTPYDATFISDEWHGNPVTTLAGRQILIGYTGWTSSHGINTTERYRAVVRYSRDKRYINLIDAYNVTYYVTQTDNKIMKPYNEHWEKIHEFRPYVVYRRFNNTLFSPI